MKYVVVYDFPACDTTTVIIVVDSDSAENAATEARKMFNDPRPSVSMAVREAGPKEPTGKDAK